MTGEPACSVDLQPLGVRLEIARGATLDAILPAYGVEFPCGGAGICRGCRVRVLASAITVTREMEEVFTPEELAAGWRLACRACVEGPLVLEIAQWSAPVLAGEARFAVEPAEGCGIAIDLGTTTLAAQRVDLSTGETLAVETALNPQAAWGADVMSRIQFARACGAATLASAIHSALGELISRMPRRDSVRLALVAGNTVMHHVFCGIDVSPLAHAPFETTGGGERALTPRTLG